MAENNSFSGILVDSNLQVRLVLETLPSGGQKVLQKIGEEWQALFKIPFEDVQTSFILDFDETNEGIYLLDSRGRNTAALVHMQLDDQSVEVLAESDRVDVNSVLFDQSTHTPFAYAPDLIRPE